MVWTKKKFSRGTWLSKFRFNDLPLELQILIGEFTVESSEPIEILFGSTGMNYFDVDPNFLAMARICHRLHKPLMRHFFKANTFECESYTSTEYTWLGGVGWGDPLLVDQYLKYVRYLTLELPSTWESIECAWYSWSSDYPGLEILEIKVNWMDEDKGAIEKQCKKYKKLFECCPALRYIAFRPMLEIDAPEDQHIPDVVIQKLHLAPGSQGRKASDVVVCYGARGTTTPERHQPISLRW